MNPAEPLRVPRSLYGWVAALPKDGRAVARRSDNPLNLEFVMHRTPLSFLPGRAIAGWVVAFVLMAVAGTASAQVTAVTGTSCKTILLQNPSLSNPLSLQAGTVTFELWGTMAIPTSGVASLFQLTGLQSVELVSVRTAAQNASRGCPSVASASLRLRSDGAIRDVVKGTLTVPLANGTRQSIGLRAVPYPAISWTWTNAAPSNSCVLAGFSSFSYPSNRLLRIVTPQSTAVDAFCTANVASRITAGSSDAHVKGPVPVRLTTDLTLTHTRPVPMSPESMPTEILKGPGSSVTVPVVLSHQGMLKFKPHGRDYALEVATPNGNTSALQLSVVLPNVPVFTGPIQKRSLFEATGGLNAGAKDAITFSAALTPAAPQLGHTITWRVSNPACFAARSGAFNPASPLQTFLLPAGQTIFEVTLTALDTPACLPPLDGRIETIEAWSGTDVTTREKPFYSTPTTFRVIRP